MSTAAHSEVSIPPSRFVRGKEKTFVGDFGFGYWSANHRTKLFLPSNLKDRALSQHDHANNLKIAKSIGQDDSASKQLPFRNASDYSVSSPTIMRSKRVSQNGESPNDRGSARRSARGRVDKPWEHENAALVIERLNIRKKLNFKENANTSIRPSKRVKRDSDKCMCALTIWDNRPGAGEKPLVADTRDCSIAKDENTSTGGDLVLDIKLDRPFVVPASKLKVAAERAQPGLHALIDNYFLEIKILPQNNEIEWPPIPILGKQGGPLFGRGPKAPSQDQQRFLVASYQKLPEAPATDVALSVSFYEKGISFLTKYGLAVSSTWSNSADIQQIIEVAKHGEGSEEEELSLPETPVRGRLDVTGQSNHAIVNCKENPSENGLRTTESRQVLVQPARRVKVHYEWFKATSKFPHDSFTRDDFSCPMCRSTKFSGFSELHRHLRHTHTNLLFAAKPSSRTTQADCFALEITHAIPRKDDDESSKEWSHVASGEQPLINRSEIRAQNNGFLPAMYVPDFRKPRRKRYHAVGVAATNGSSQPMYTSISHRPIQLDEDSRSETEDEIDDEWLIERQLETLEIQAKREGKNDYELELWKRWERHRMDEKLEHPRFLSDCLVRFVRKHVDWLRLGYKAHPLLHAFYDFLGELKERRVIDDNIVADITAMIFPPRTAPNGGVLDSSPNTIVVENTSSDTVRTTAPATYNAADLFGGPLVKARPTPSSRIGTTPTPATNESSRPHEPLDTDGLLSLPPGLCGVCQKPVSKLLRLRIHCTNTKCLSPSVPYHRKCVKIRADHDYTDWSCRICAERVRAEKGKARETEPPAMAESDRHEQQQQQQPLQHQHQREEGQEGQEYNPKSMHDRAEMTPRAGYLDATSAMAGELDIAEEEEEEEEETEWAKEEARQAQLFNELMRASQAGGPYGHHMQAFVDAAVDLAMKKAEKKRRDKQ